MGGTCWAAVTGGGWWVGEVTVESGGWLGGVLGAGGGAIPPSTWEGVATGGGADRGLMGLVAAGKVRSDLEGDTGVEGAGVA